MVRVPFSAHLDQDDPGSHSSARRLRDHPMHIAYRAFFGVLLAASTLAVAAKTPPKHTSTPGTAKTILPAELKPGEYAWHPELSPNGPIVLIVSLPDRLAYVYRNG